jgi:GH24 family phage-related lysozyme (muramidase)
MASENILSSFLVAIGFKLDEQQYKRFQETMDKVGKNAVELTKGFVGLAEASLAAGSVLATTLTAAAKQLEGLYFASKRTGASAKELQTFSFAAEQIGVSAEQARGAVEGLALARRTNPGLNGVLANLGIDPRQKDNAKVFLELLAKLHSMPEYQGAQMASLFGIDENTYLQLNKNLPELQKALAMREKLFAATGVDPDKADEQAHEFMVQLRLLEAGLLDITEIMATRLIPWGEKAIGWLETMVLWIAKADKATDGWSTKLLALASAIGVPLLAKTAAQWLLGGIGGALGLGAAEGAVAGGAVAAEGGLLASVAPILGPLVAMVIAAVAAAMGLKALDAKYGTGIRASIGLTDDVDKNQQIIADKFHSFTKRWEGHAKDGYGVYKDIAGHLTAGIGHLVRPGEDLSHLDQAGSDALFAKDWADAASAVKGLVRRNLNANQMEAVTDFVFQFGKGAFGKSTLLKDLNAGNFEDAAAQFAHWNKAMVNGHLVVNQGLVNREAQRAAMFRGGGVTISQKSDYHISSTDPHGAGREVAGHQSRANADLVRNFAVAAQ